MTKIVECQDKLTWKFAESPLLVYL